MKDSTKDWFNRWFKPPTLNITGAGFSTPAHYIQDMSGYFSSPDSALGVITVTPKSIYYYTRDQTLLFDAPLTEAKIRKAFFGITLRIEYKDKVYVLSPTYEHFVDLVTPYPVSVNSSTSEFMRKIKKFQKDIKVSEANS